MESMGIVQARTPESVKENATNILEKLGLNMSTYINMALNQLIIQEGIPFAVKLAKSSYTDEEKIKEVAATLRMEGLKLSDSDLSMLQKIKSGIDGALKGYYYMRISIVYLSAGSLLVKRFPSFQIWVSVR